MTTISRLARQFKLSRSTLLYYDRIGLLRPSNRSPSNYRLYTGFDHQRLEKICYYRRLGLSLKAIQQILDQPDDSIKTILEQRLREVDGQIKALRHQQQVILKLIGTPAFADMAGGLNREKWTTLLRAAGMSDQDMLQWHIEFERLFPDDHQAFLASLGIPQKDIDVIRAFSRPDTT